MTENQILDNDQSDQANQAQYEKTVILIGKTKSGKTTLINGFIDPVNLTLRVNEDTESSIDVKILKEGLEIGHDADSQTDKAVAYIDKDKKIKYIDLPGFSDSRKGQDAENAGIIREAFTENKNQEIQVLVAIQYDHITDLQNFNSIINSLEQLFKNLENKSDAFGLVITKVEENKSKFVLGNIRKNLCSSSVSVSGKKLIEYLIKNNKIKTFKAAYEEVDLIAEVENVTALLDRLGTFKVTKADDEEFGFAVSPSTKVELSNKAQELYDIIKTAMSSIYEKIAQTYKIQLESAKSFEEVEARQENVIQLLEQVKRGIEQNEFPIDLLQKLDLNLSTEINRIYDSLEELTQIQRRVPNTEVFDKDWFSLDKLITLQATAKDLIEAEPELIDNNILRIKSSFTGTGKILEKIIQKNAVLKAMSSVSSEAFLKGVEVYISNTIFFDVDLVCEALKEINFSIIAPNWVIERPVIIDISGRDGKPHIPAKAANGVEPSSTPENSAGNPGIKGEDGLPGNSGENGGNFIGVGANFTGIENLTINVSGGRGGQGQDGGDGSNGTDSSKNGDISDVQSMAISCLTETEIFVKYKNELLSQKFESKGLEGGKGGDGGKGGAGGIGGYAGKLLFVNQLYEVIPIVVNKQLDQLLGAIGAAGKAGEGGANGEVYLGTYIPYSYQNMKTAGITNALEVAKAVVNAVAPATAPVVGAVVGAVAVAPATVVGAVVGAVAVAVAPVAAPVAVAAVGAAAVGAAVGGVVGAGRSEAQLLLQQYLGWQGNIKKIVSKANDGKTFDEKDLNMNGIKYPKKPSNDDIISYLFAQLIENYKKYIDTLDQELIYFIADNVQVIFDKKNIEDIKLPEAALINDYHITDIPKDEVRIQGTNDDDTEIFIQEIPQSIQNNAFNSCNNLRYEFQRNDIKVIQKQLLYKALDNINQISLIEPSDGHQTIEQLSSRINQAFNVTSSTHKPALFIFNQDDVHWFSTAIIKTDNETIIIQKGAFKINEGSVTQVLNNLNNSMRLILNNSSTEEYKKEDGGIIALQNLRIMAEQLIQDQESFIQNFENFTGFCEAEEITNLRKEFAQHYLIGIYNNIIEHHRKNELKDLVIDNHKIDIEKFLQDLENFFAEVREEEFVIEQGHALDDLNQPTIETIITEINEEAKDYEYKYKISWNGLEIKEFIDFDKCKDIETYLLNNNIAVIMDIEISLPDRSIIITPIIGSKQYGKNIDLTPHLPTINEMFSALHITSEEDKQEVLTILNENHLTLAEEPVLQLLISGGDTDLSDPAVESLPLIGDNLQNIEEHYETN